MWAAANPDRAAGGPDLVRRGLAAAGPGPALAWAAAGLGRAPAVEARPAQACWVRVQMAALAASCPPDTRHTPCSHQHKFRTPSNSPISANAPAPPPDNPSVWDRQNGEAGGWHCPG
ncbi:hypothetical protein GCM10010178_06600 [Lentzea flava]|uniref:Uncharacterized protein n=1 Tax=Lentzea flava TaxID=103732 RepID=A0ABQ2UDS4_9PSEU|nr:hypothetical protein GCM10010178_06600 [Lentzea flava]